MMVLTIRARLTIWYSLSFSAVLLLVLGVLALELHKQLGNEAQETLLTEETWITTLFETEFLPLIGPSKGANDTLFADLSEDLEERYGLKRQFAVLRPELGSEKNFFHGGLQNLDRLLPLGFHQRPPGSYDMMIGASRYRVRIFRRDWGKGAVGVENETIFKVAEEAGEILVWVVPLCVILAIGGGWFLAKLALRPVVSAAQAAESISMTNLKKRLSTYSGKDEFGALVATFNRMISRLEEGVNRLQQFTQDAAHELRTPLAILRGDLELAYQENEASEEGSAFLQRTLDRVIALGRIVDNLMLLARSDSGNYPIYKTLFRLDVVVQGILEDLQVLAEGRSLAVHLHTSEALEFLGDELLIRRLLMNLCDNALKHTAQGKIILALQKTKAAIIFTISDTGEGIPPEDLPHIFDRFYRVDKSRSTATGGSGLGLAICQWIVAAHNGEITVRSTVGAGTTVRVRFPHRS